MVITLGVVHASLKRIVNGGLPINTCQSMVIELHAKDAPKKPITIHLMAALVVEHSRSGMESLLRSGFRWSKNSRAYANCVGTCLINVASL